MLGLDSRQLAKLMNTLISSYACEGDGEELSEYLADRLSELSTHQQHINKCFQEIEELRKKHHKAVGDVLDEIAALRDQCSHPCVEKYYDPSGNGDNYSKCHICGLDL